MQKVLIVDDDPVGAQLLATLLELERFKAIQLESWTDPLGDLEHHRPNLVIMDVRLQSKSGFDILKQIREHPDSDIAGTPVLMMSVDDHRIQSRRAGANGFIAKPFDLPSLLRAIRDVKEGRLSND